MADPAQRRENMVAMQIARRGVADARVLDAMRRVPRERFVPEHLAEFAHEDSPLPLAAGQTISQPYIVARMIEAAEIAPKDRVLEIGAGSGYAAAVMSVIADDVYAIERHPELADTARGRLAELGYANVEVRTGDGTLGWPRAAPFDAILVAASGPDVPDVLRRQLAVGGRLVMPVGGKEGLQRLAKITRRGEDDFSEEDLGPVAFVPLIGEHGWREEGGGPPSPPPARAGKVSTVAQRIGSAAQPLGEIDDAAFGAAFDRFAGARVVLLGEASHGTSEFYRARCAITRRLIERHGFTIVAVEADWPDAASLDRFVRPRSAARDAGPEGAEPPFDRFPTWMWRNAEVEAFTRWLRGHNEKQAPARQAGFYGLDLYSLNGSIHAVIDYLERIDPRAAGVARERYGCLTPWRAAPQSYGRMALNAGFASCEKPVVAMLRELNGRRMRYAADDGEQFLDASANARLVKDAEAYYRAMYFGAAESWNIRARHMFDTLCQILDSKGPGARAVIWAHNSHIGDARHTDMGWTHGELNIGQLCRERFADEAAMIGLGTHVGAVAAADDWGAAMKVKTVNPSRSDSYERLAHDSGVPCFLLDLRNDVREELLQPRLERFIGVIYRPETEFWSHYSEACLPRQFDSYLWFDETKAITPLATPQTAAGGQDTYPFGL